MSLNSFTMETDDETDVKKNTTVKFVTNMPIARSILKNIRNQRDIMQPNKNVIYISFK